MPLPTLTKTWQFQVNQLVIYETSATVTARKVIIAIKNSLVGAGSWTSSAGTATTVTGGWTVVRSAGRLAGLGAASVDAWGNDPAELLGSFSGNRAWMVLENADGVQLMFGMIANDAPQTMIFAVSESGGFGSFSATALPTASDAAQTTMSIGTQNVGVMDYYVHAMLSSDGECFRVLIARNGFAVGTWMFDTIANPRPGLNTVFGAIGNTNSTSTTQSSVGSGGFLSGSSSNLRFWYDGSNRVASFTCEGNVTGLAGLQLSTGQNSFDDSWYAGSMGYWGHTSGAVGKMGEVVDMWVGPAGRNSGDGFPGASPGPANQFIQHAFVIFPWNTTEMLVAA